MSGCGWRIWTRRQMKVPSGGNSGKKGDGHIVWQPEGISYGQPML